MSVEKAVPKRNRGEEMRVDRTRRMSPALPSGLRAWLATACLTLLAMLISVGTAQAEEFAFVPGSFKVELSDSQAGGHPDITTTFQIEGEELDPVLGMPRFRPFEIPKDMVIDMPPGLIGNPQAMPKCEPSDFPNCPVETQVGFATVKLQTFPIVQSPVFNVRPAAGKAAQFAFNAVGFDIQMTAEIRSDGDYGLRMVVPDAPSNSPIWASEVTFWGVPAAAEHDLERGVFCGAFLPPGMCLQMGTGEPQPPEGIPSMAPKVPFNIAPVKCDGPMKASITANSWDNPGKWIEAETEIPAFEGCDKLTFSPTLDVKPTSTRAGGPTGLDVEIEVPQTNAPQVPSTPPLRDAVVRLPEGMVISPSAADGLKGCSNAEIGIGTLDRPSCPRESSIGSVTIISPLQEEPMTGAIYQGTQTSSQLLRIFLFAEGGGVQLKLAGRIDTDPETGRLTAMFEDQPMLQASRISLRFKGGQRAVLINPTQCGTHSAESEITAWSGQVARPTGSFTLSDGCGPRTFAPDLIAGTRNPQAGSPSELSLLLRRGEGDRELKSLQSIRLPEGLLGRVGSVPGCAEPQAASGDCPESSKVGHLAVAAGAGNSPLWLPQTGKRPTAVYLTGPYRGAPYGLSLVVPAQAGPFDLGTVVVRSALHVDERTTQVSVGVDESRIFDTDGSLVEVIEGALPTILKGIRLNLREIRVVLDRPGFIVNPTDCSPKQIGARVVSVNSDLADLSYGFGAAGCATLGFAPRFNARILDRGRKSTLRSFHPRTRFTVVPRKGDANIGAARVVLPSSVLLDQANIGTTCTRAQMAANDCPEAAIVGHARAWSPLLQRPVQGPVYLAANGGVRPLPDLAAVMDGEIRVRLMGEISTLRGGGKARLQNTFRAVPDAPVSRFVLTMRGGAKRGLLVNSTDLCRTNERGVAVFRGQNGRTHRLRPRIATAFRGCAKVRRQAARRSTARKSAARKVARKAAATARSAMR